MELLWVEENTFGQLQSTVSLADMHGGRLHCMLTSHDASVVADENAYPPGS